jgi:hypothetical protein
MGAGKAQGAGTDIPPEALQAGANAVRDFLDGHSTLGAILQQAPLLAERVYLAMAAHLPMAVDVLAFEEAPKEIRPDKIGRGREP